MESKHTPGPWGIDNPVGIYGITMTETWYRRIYALDPDGDRDFTIGFVRDPDEQVREANARLLAAAPELLESLEAMVAQIMRPEQSSIVQDFTKACAVIAKARGTACESPKQ